MPLTPPEKTQADVLDSPLQEEEEDDGFRVWVFLAWTVRAEHEFHLWPQTTISLFKVHRCGKVFQ